MPVAAVPAYLGQDFKDASPGMRFGLLLPIWTDRADQEAEVRKRGQARSREGREIAELLERRGMDATIAELRNRSRNPLPWLWEKNDFAARKAWDTVRELPPRDRQLMQAMVQRSSAIAASMPATQCMTIQAQSIAPFTTGLGNEHPLENGFSFLWPYGLPYLPGSGVKGVLRRAAQELAGGDWGDARGWTCAAIDVLFGREDSDHAQRGVLSFWDVIPQIKGDSLMVEIMTPHQSHYYQQKNERGAGRSTTPHDSGQPNPIAFLTVPPGSTFSFHVVCDVRRLERLDGALLGNDGGQPRWHTLLEAAFEHAFAWLGFGAKTAVGYGAMQYDRQARQRALEEQRQRQAEQERQQRLAQLSPAQRALEEFHARMQARANELRGRKTAVGQQDYQALQALAKQAQGEGWSAADRAAAADAIEKWGPQLVNIDAKELRKKLGLAALRGSHG